ncbi:carboxypeptidase regulatory-like domain-containing protein [bacterium]|nr:carboxypeptidase regulatory-like domain-containing protein [bacterium]
MKTHFEKSLVYLAMLCLMVVVTLSANADWFHDFEAPLPPSFMTQGLTLSGAPSPTFESSVEGGFLTLSDSKTPKSGGSIFTLGAEMSEVFSDVRVTGTVNVSETTQNDLSLFARGDLDTLSAYVVSIDFIDGVVSIGKSIGGVMVDSASTHIKLPRLDTSYFVQFDVVGNQLASRVFNREGGTQLLDVNYTDIGVGGPPFISGVSGIVASTESDEIMINATFDNVSSTVISETIIGSVKNAFTERNLYRAIVMTYNIKNKETTIAHTNEGGYYEFLNLKPGIYLVLAIKKGYKTVVKTAEIVAGAGAMVDFMLTPKLE